MNDGDLLLAAIARCPGEKTIKLQYVDWILEHPAVARERITAAMAREPRLTVRELEDLHKAPNFDACRDALLGAVREWAACRAWLASRKRRRYLDRTRDAYAVLHTVGCELPEYVVPWKMPADQGGGPFAGWRAGPLMAAALDAGFEVYDWFGTGTYLNVGDRLRPADKPRPKKQRRRKPGDQWVEAAGIDWRTAP